MDIEYIIEMLREQGYDMEPLLAILEASEWFGK